MSNVIQTKPGTTIALVEIPHKAKGIQILPGKNGLRVLYKIKDGFVQQTLGNYNKATHLGKLTSLDNKVCRSLVENVPGYGFKDYYGDGTKKLTSRASLGTIATKLGMPVSQAHVFRLQ